MKPIKSIFTFPYFISSIGWLLFRIHFSRNGPFQEMVNAFLCTWLSAQDSAQAAMRWLQTSLAVKYSNVHEQMKMKMEELHVSKVYGSCFIFFEEAGYRLNSWFYDKAKCIYWPNTGKLLSMGVPGHVITNWNLGPDISCHNAQGPAQCLVMMYLIRGSV